MGLAFALRHGLQARRVVLIAGPGSFGGALRRFASGIGLAPAVFPRFQQCIEAHTGVPASALEAASLVATLHTPAIVVHDPADREVPFIDAFALAAHWPGARLYPVEGRGHRRILAAKEVIAETVAFLTAGLAPFTQVTPASDAR